MGDWRSKIKKYHSYKAPTKKKTPAPSKAPSKSSPSAPQSKVPDYLSFGQTKQPQSIDPRYLPQSQAPPSVPDYTSFGTTQQPQSMAPAPQAQSFTSKATGFVKKVASSFTAGVERVQDIVDQPGARAAREKMSAQGYSSLTPAEQRAATDISGRVLIGGASIIKLKGDLAKVAIQRAAARASKQAVSNIGKIPHTAKGYAANTKTTKQLTNVFTQIGSKIGLPIQMASTVATMAMGIYGMKILAGFVGTEENIQTADFSLRNAAQIGQDTGNWTLYDEMIAHKEIILSDEYQKEIKEGIPGPGTLKAIDGYAETSRLKLVIDKEWAENERLKQEEGLTDDEKWAMIKEKEVTQEKEMIDYYNSERIRMLELERQARVDQRNDDAAFWAQQQEQQLKREAEDRQAIADFWNAYHKTAAKNQEDSRPSKLNFGLL